jgi:hypothetical protein
MGTIAASGAKALLALVLTFVFPGFAFPALAQTMTDAAPAPFAAQRYPTSDEVYYVKACMGVNGDNAEGLQKCSCAVNALEARLPFEQYRDAQMVLALRQAGGRNASLFRDTAPMKAIVKQFVNAQADANHVCFGAPQTTQKTSLDTIKRP